MEELKGALGYSFWGDGASSSTYGHCVQLLWYVVLFVLFLEVFVSAQLVIGLKMAWDQEFSSGLMLVTIMIFQFRSAVTVAPKLVVRFDILQDPCTWRLPWRPARAFGACGSLCFSWNRGIGFTTPCPRVL